MIIYIHTYIQGIGGADTDDVEQWRGINMSPYVEAGGDDTQARHLPQVLGWGGSFDSPSFTPDPSSSPHERAFLLESCHVGNFIHKKVGLGGPNEWIPRGGMILLLCYLLHFVVQWSPKGHQLCIGSCKRARDGWSPLWESAMNLGFILCMSATLCSIY